MGMRKSFLKSKTEKKTENRRENYKLKEWSQKAQDLASRNSRIAPRERRRWRIFKKKSSLRKNISLRYMVFCIEILCPVCMSMTQNTCFERRRSRFTLIAHEHLKKTNTNYHAVSSHWAPLDEAQKLTRSKQKNHMLHGWTIFRLLWLHKSWILILTK